MVTSLVKQWLNHMRQGDAEAARRFQRLKRLTALDELLAGLAADTPGYEEAAARSMMAMTTAQAASAG